MYWLESDFVSYNSVLSSLSQLWLNSQTQTHVNISIWVNIVYLQRRHELICGSHSVKYRFLKWEGLTIHIIELYKDNCTLSGFLAHEEVPVKHVLIHILGWKGEGWFVVHCIYFMATDFKQISDSPYCLIICLGGWAIYELLALQLLKQCTISAPFISQPPKFSRSAILIFEFRTNVRERNTCRAV